MNSKYYITTTLPYVNAKPHIGFALEIIQADVLARWQKGLGKEVFFNTGTDEHGDKIVKAAAAEGKTPEAYCDEISGAFKSTWQKLGLTPDDFIRTTEPRHKAVVQQILQKIYDAGDIYAGEYSGKYCFGCERYLTDKELNDFLRTVDRRAFKRTAYLVRDDDAALDIVAAQGATLPGRFTRRYLLDASGEKPVAQRSARLLEPDLIHCGVALVEQAVGQHFLVIVLVSARTMDCSATRTLFCSKTTPGPKIGAVLSQSRAGSFRVLSHP